MLDDPHFLPSMNRSIRLTLAALLVALASESGRTTGAGPPIPNRERETDPLGIPRPPLDSQRRVRLGRHSKERRIHHVDDGKARPVASASAEDRTNPRRRSSTANGSPRTRRRRSSCMPITMGNRRIRQSGTAASRGNPCFAQQLSSEAARSFHFPLTAQSIPSTASTRDQHRTTKQE